MLSQYQAHRGSFQITFFFFFMRMMCLDFIEIERFHDTVKDKSYELSSIYHLTAIEKDATLFL